jgi:transposase
MARPRKHPEELLDRGVRLLFESGPADRARGQGSRDDARGLAQTCSAGEADNGTRPDLPTTAEREEIR